MFDIKATFDHRLAKDGQEAVDAYKEAAMESLRASGTASGAARQSRAFDVVLMDCRMPKLSGFEASRVIRQFEAKHNLPRVPILALTAGHEQAKVRERGSPDHVHTDVDTDAY